MSDRHLNYFFPYGGDVGHFETSLTRAFFALLKLCPPVHAHLVGLVRDKNPALPPFVDLQPESFSLELEVSSLAAEDGDAVLVHLTGAPALGPVPARKTEDNRRYDAVLSYDSGWALICEAKIGAADQKDASARISHRLNGSVVEIRWNDLIESVWRLMECGLLRGTEEALARQFLEYVEMKFESLCPYSSIGRCGGSQRRIDARCTQILRGISSTDGNKLNLGANATARYALLNYTKDKEEGFVVLGLYPADTIAQARTFYTSAAIEATARLQQDWDIYPNLHLAFMQKNCVLLKSEVDLNMYLRYWLDRMPRHGQAVAGDVQKTGFLTAFNELVSAGLATEADRQAFNQHFMETARQTMNICPGVAAEYYWPLKNAERLDAQGRFAADVHSRLTEGLAAWGQTLPPAGQTEPIATPA